MFIIIISGLLATRSQTVRQLHPPPLHDLYTNKQLQQYSPTRVLRPHWRGARDGPTAFASLQVLPSQFFSRLPWKHHSNLLSTGNVKRIFMPEAAASQMMIHTFCYILRYAVICVDAKRGVARRCSHKTFLQTYLHAV
jgi:hypothetical protein